MKDNPKINFEKLEALYLKYNRRNYVNPDPLFFLYQYPNKLDQEIVGLIASSFAYGRVGQILKSVKMILDPMGRHPRQFIEQNNSRNLFEIYSAFYHRWHRTDDLVGLLGAIRKTIACHGSLKACFLLGCQTTDADILGGLTYLAKTLIKTSPHPLQKNLLPIPEDESACKRWHLFLRWMIRKDAVDPGPWYGIGAEKLLVPVDVHMHRISLQFGFTRRRQANLKTVLEITQAFKKWAPLDPVRYDFVLTRFGIRDDLGSVFDTKWSLS